MPLEPYQRGRTWWARGRIDYNGRAITGFTRRSTGSPTRAGAIDWIRETEAGEIRRHILGETPQLTFSQAVILYPAKPAEAKFLDRILDHLGTLPVANITPQAVRDLGPIIYPMGASDTWRRQIIGPVSAVINHAHDLGRCAPIRIKAYSSQERIDQDARRGKQSRVEKTPGSWEWIGAFCAGADPYNAALAEFMFETGARVGQAVALVPGDLDLGRARVRLGASKGHAEQWVAISSEMVVRLANLPPKRPIDSQRGRIFAPKVFGYATRQGMLKTWRRICARAGIEYLPPHSAGRHGYYTELTVRQGVDPITAAKAGRWSDPSLPDRIYAHSEASDAEIRAKIRAGRRD